MKTSTQLALVYGIAAAGAAAVAYYRGKAVEEILLDSLIHGAVVGTGVNVVIWLASESSPVLANPAPPTGSLGVEAVRLLSQVNPEVVLKTVEKAGVRIGPAPEDPHMINPPPDPR